MFWSKGQNWNNPEKNRNSQPSHFEFPFLFLSVYFCEEKALFQDALKIFYFVPSFFIG